MVGPPPVPQVAAFHLNSRKQGVNRESIICYHGWDTSSSVKKVSSKCHREQIVTADKMNKALPFRYCGFIIQPQLKDTEFSTRKHKMALFHQSRKQRAGKIR